MITTISRLFRAVLAPRPLPPKLPSLKDVAHIRHALLLAMEDCSGVSSDRLRLKIDHAQSPQELWLLRNDAYQVISQCHSQSMAAERINALLEHFEGWVDAKQLARIS